jgi:tetratricopeptide (TPR) repeat protein
VVHLSFSQTVENLLDSGFEKYSNSEYEQAIQIFSQAIKEAPDNPEIYFLRGLSYHGNKEVEKSVKDLERAIELNPSYFEAYQELGYIYLVGQAPALAIAQFDKAIEINPEAAEVYVNRGTAKCMLNDVSGAESDWEKAKKLGVQYSEYMKCQ